MNGADKGNISGVARFAQSLLKPRDRVPRHFLKIKYFLRVLQNRIRIKNEAPKERIIRRVSNHLLNLFFSKCAAFAKETSNNIRFVFAGSLTNVAKVVLRLGAHRFTAMDIVKLTKHPA